MELATGTAMELAGGGGEMGVEMHVLILARGNFVRQRIHDMNI
jgi:hypothetical protein